MDTFKKFWDSYKKKRSEKKNKKKILLIQKYGEKICNSITEEFEKNHIEFFFFFGTMLGFVREQNFIKHDTDIDLCVVENRDFTWKKLEKILANLGLEKRREILCGGYITEQTYSYKKLLNIDFFSCYTREQHSEIYSYFKKDTVEYKDKNEYSVGVNKLSKIEEYFKYQTSLGMMTIPINYLSLLEELYGKDWKIPDANYNYEESPSWGVLSDKRGYQKN